MQKIRAVGDRWGSGLLLPVLIAGAIYLGGATSRVALLDDADSVHAEAAREMLERTDWVTLYVNGVRYLEKAPLIYWAMAASFKFLGPTEFAARLPNALATLLLIFVVIRFGQWAFNSRAGLYAGLILATSPGLFLFTRIALPDVILTLWLTCAVYCFLRARDETQSERWWILGVYFFSALGVLTKGLIGAVFPGMIVAFTILWTKDWATFKRLHWVAGTSLFLLVAAPWHLLAGLRTKGFFWFYFVNEQFLRYLGRRYPVDYDTVPRPLFWALHLVWFFPWILFFPQVARALKSGWTTAGRELRTIRLLIIWVCGILLFFSFSTTQEYYSMPIYPAVALLIGLGLARCETRSPGWSRHAAIWVGAFMALISLGAGIVLYAARHVRATGDIATFLTRNPQYYALSLGHVMDLTLPSFSELRFHLAGTSAVFGVGAILVWLCARKEKAIGVALVTAMTMAAFFYFAERARSIFEPYLSSRPFAHYLEAHYTPNDRVVIDGEYESGSSVNFYTRRPVYLLNGRSADLEYGSYFPDAPKLFLVDSEFAKLWQGPDRVYVVTPNEHRERLRRLLLLPVYEVFGSGGKSLLSNRTE